MKNILLVLGILIIGIVAVFSLRRPSPTPIAPTPSNQVTTPQYQPYSASLFETASDKRRILFFYANWCPTCRPLDLELNAQSAELPADVVVFRVNYNDSDTDATEKVLAEVYNITYQHTFVEVDERGSATNTWNGGNFADLLTNLK